MKQLNCVISFFQLHLTLHAYVRRFDMTGTVGFFFRTKHDLIFLCAHFDVQQLHLKHSSNFFSAQFKAQEVYKFSILYTVDSKKPSKQFCYSNMNASSCESSTYIQRELISILFFFLSSSSLFFHPKMKGLEGIHESWEVGGLIPSSPL